MKESRDHLSLDLKTVQYLDAMNAGDLEAVAALWDASRLDRRLEQALTELEGELFAEEASTRLVAHQSQLPSHRRPQRTWPARLGLSGLIAAACLLVFLSRLDRGDREVGPVDEPIVLPSSLPVADQRFDFALLKARRDLDLSEMPRFAWPLRTEMSLRSSAMVRPDVLD